MQLSIRIKDIAEGGTHLEVPYSRVLLQDSLAGHEVDLEHSHARAHIDIDRTGDTISIHGRLEGQLDIVCSRCLGEAHLPLSVPLRVIIGPESMGAEDSVVDEIEYFTHDGETVELEPVLRETLILAVPMSPLCREDCKGLCPTCGCDRNTTVCECAEKVVDPRLVALKDIKL